MKVIPDAKQKSIPTCIKANDKIVTDKQSISELFNTYFIFKQLKCLKPKNATGLECLPIFPLKLVQHCLNGSKRRLYPRSNLETNSKESPALIF